MEKIVKKDGYVYLVSASDQEWRHTTWQNLGKDPDDSRWKDSKNKKKKKKSED